MNTSTYPSGNLRETHICFIDILEQNLFHENMDSSLWSSEFRCTLDQIFEDDSSQKRQRTALKRVPTQCQIDNIIFRQISYDKCLNKSEIVIDECD